MTLSPLQDCLTEEEKASVFQRALVDVVNQVGVDLNAAVAHPWRQFALRYVCGLGPRKAGALVAAVRAGDGGAVEMNNFFLAFKAARDIGAFEDFVWRYEWADDDADKDKDKAQTVVEAPGAVPPGAASPNASRSRSVWPPSAGGGRWK